MKKITIYIDESGTLPDPHDKIVVIAAVGTLSVDKIDILSKRIRRKHSLNKPITELKFYTAGEKTKILFFNSMIQKDFKIFVLIVDKEGRRIPDTPENYAALCSILISDIFKFKFDIGKIIFDRHFSRNIDIERFNSLINVSISKNLELSHVGSMKDKRINIADMVAGAVLADETNKDKRFYKLIERKVISSKKISWREVKRRFIVLKKLA